MVVVDIGYSSIVLPADKALKLVEMLQEAEAYEFKYISKEERERLGASSDNLHFVYPSERTYSMKVISDDLYRMAKLAGKPEKT